MAVPTAPRPAPRTPSARPPGPKLDAHAVQHTWLRDHRGQAIGVRLLDGKLLRGDLLAFDTFTLTVRLTEGGMVLLFKQAIAYLVPVRAESGPSVP